MSLGLVVFGLLVWAGLTFLVLACCAVGARADSAAAAAEERVAWVFDGVYEGAVRPVDRLTDRVGRHELN